MVFEDIGRESRISEVVRPVESVKNYENWLTLGKSYCNNTKGDVFIGPLCSAYCLILHCRHCRRDHFSLQKRQKNTRCQRRFSENFSGGIAPRSPYWGGATSPLPRQTPPPRRSGASRLARDLRSLHRRVWSPKNP